jgi:hypothetical protein
MCTQAVSLFITLAGDHAVLSSLLTIHLLYLFPSLLIGYEYSIKI